MGLQPIRRLFAKMFGKWAPSSGLPDRVLTCARMLFDGQLVEHCRGCDEVLWGICRPSRVESMGPGLRKLRTCNEDVRSAPIGVLARACMHTVGAPIYCDACRNRFAHRAKSWIVAMVFRDCSGCCETQSCCDLVSSLRSRSAFKESINVVSQAANEWHARSLFADIWAVGSDMGMRRGYAERVAREGVVRQVMC